MTEVSSIVEVVYKRIPWNKGKIVGAKPPLCPKHVWSIRTKLQVEGRVRDLALFNLAIDSKLRGCDVVAIKVEDIAPWGYAVDRATVRQKKTGRPVKFEKGVPDLSAHGQLACRAAIIGSPENREYPAIPRDRGRRRARNSRTS
jgi:hypothetical protein